ncbi:MAG: hypothetical protein HRU20_11425 [Pseudomonadales bacterium]|nr:hypothetical protein [Pseudomonadales bacterium]
MKTSTLNSCILSISVLFLAACNAEDETTNDPSLSSITGTATDSQTETHTDTSTHMSMDMLTIAADHPLSSTSTLEVLISPNSKSITKAVILICLPDADNNSIPDYQNCLSRSHLSEHSQSIALTLPNHVDRLFTSIWETGKNQASQIEIWQRDSSDASTWKINI